MKISQKQAQLLAERVKKELEKIKGPRIADSVKSQIEVWAEERERLYQAERRAKDALNAFDSTLYKIIGRVGGIYAGDKPASIIRKLEEKSIPSVTAIADEIILAAMFTTEEDLEQFIAKVTKKFTPRRKKIESN